MASLSCWIFFYFTIMNGLFFRCTFSDLPIFLVFYFFLYLFRKSSLSVARMSAILSLRVFWYVASMSA